MTDMLLRIKQNQRELIKQEVKIRVERSKDKAGKVDYDLFTVLNPGIHEPMHEWLNEQTRRYTALSLDIYQITGGPPETELLSPMEPEKRSWLRWLFRRRS